MKKSKSAPLASNHTSQSISMDRTLLPANATSTATVNANDSVTHKMESRVKENTQTTSIAPALSSSISTSTTTNIKMSGYLKKKRNVSFHITTVCDIYCL